MRSLLFHPWLFLLALSCIGTLPACKEEDSFQNATPPTIEQGPPVGTIETFVELEDRSEGLAFGVDPEGKPTLYIGSKSSVLRVDEKGTITTVVDIPQPLGMAKTIDNNIVVCAKASGEQGKSEHPGAIWKVTPKGQAEMLVSSTEEAPLDLPNMIAVTPDGTLVFSDSKGNRVYSIAPGSTTVTLITDQISYPNGVAFKQDGSALLVASYDTKTIYALPYLTNNQWGIPKVFMEDVDSVDGITPLQSQDFILVQTTEGVVLAKSTTEKTSIAKELAKDMPANGAFGVGVFGTHWLYVSNFFAKRISRVSIGRPGATLPIQPGHDEEPSYNYDE